MLSNPKLTKKTYFFDLLIIILLIIIIFLLFNNSSKFSILLINFLLCSYLASIFKSNYRFLFYINPIILFVAGQFFEQPFLERGDAAGYLNVLQEYYNFERNNFSENFLIDIFEFYGLIGFFKYISLGALPIFAIPKYFFFNPNDLDFYLWEGTFHVLLCTLTATICRHYNLIKDEYLLTISLFSIISPSIFDLGLTPTRHILTYSSIFLLYISYLAITQKVSISRIILFTISIALMLASKAVLLIPFLAFVCFDFFFLRKTKLSTINLIIIAILLLLIISAGIIFEEAISSYEEISVTGGATFSGLTQIPVFGWVVKYIYATLAPFPWSRAEHHISTIYGGNWFLFLMHTLSSIIGMYFLLCFALKYKEINNCENDIKRLFLFGAIMSLSILKGSTGFHVYLLVYYPFFSPMIIIKSLRLNILLPIGLIALLEFFLIVAS